MVLVLVVWVALVGMGELVDLAVLVGMVGLAVVLEMAEMGQDCLLHHKSCWCETHQAELHMPHNASCRSS